MKHHKVASTEVLEERVGGMATRLGDAVDSLKALNEKVDRMFKKSVSK